MSCGFIVIHDAAEAENQLTSVRGEMPPMKLVVKDLPLCK